MNAASDGVRRGTLALRRWLTEDALPLWAEAGLDPASGAFVEAIGLDGTPLIHAPRRARVQARQVYVFAAAGRLGWDGPWRAVMTRGLEAFRARHLRPDGLFRTKAAADGAPPDETATLYDQAFALFAMAAVADVEPGRRDALAADAARLLDAVERHFAAPGPGLREADAARPWQSNPHMHLFEAALAWAELGAGARWEGLADWIGELALSRFVDAETGALREFFDADWRPAPGPDGRVVEPGHQFEWAWLLDRWGERRGRPDARAAAHRLFEIGAGHGIDPVRGVAINQLDDAFAPLDPSARLWPQTERLKAALRLASPDRRDAEVSAAIDGLDLYLRGVKPGLWRDRMKPDGGFVEEPAPASSFYHIVCALMDLFERVGV